MEVTIEELVESFRKTTGTTSPIKVTKEGIDIKTYIFKEKQKEENTKVIKDNPDLFGNGSSYDYGSQLACFPVVG